MLYFLLAWAFLAMLTLPLGTRLLAHLGLLPPFSLPPSPEAVLLSWETLLALWLGLVTLAISLLAVSLVFPLSPLVGLLVGGGLAGWAASHPGTRQRLLGVGGELRGGNGLGVGAIALLAAGFTTGPVTWGDTGLYHFGSIRWLADYGTVIGVGLFHDRFGFASSWFALAAPLNPAMLGSQVTAVTNGFVLGLLLFHLWIGLVALGLGKTSLSSRFSCSVLILLLGLLVGSNLLSELFVSPSPDIPILVLAILGGMLILQLGEETQPTRLEGLRIALLIVGAGAVTVKLSGIPLLAIAALIYLVHHYRNGWALLRGVGLVGMLLAPAMGYGWLTSGCAFYPTPVLCLDVPWRIPQEAASSALAQIQGWFLWFGTPPEGVPWVPWVAGQWFQASLMNRVMAVLGGLTLMGALWLLRYWLRVPPTRFTQAQIWLIGLALSGSVFTFATAPQIRFGLGYLLLIPALLLAWLASALGLWWQRRQGRKPWVEGIFGKGQPRLKPWLAGGAIALLVAIALIQGDGHWVVPPPLPQSRVMAAQSQDVSYVHPVEYGSELCWDAPNPCALGPLAWEIRLRNPERGLAGGVVRTGS